MVQDKEEAISNYNQKLKEQQDEEARRKMIAANDLEQERTIFRWTQEYPVESEYIDEDPEPDPSLFGMGNYTKTDAPADS